MRANNALRLPAGLLQVALEDLRTWGARGVESMVFYLGRQVERDRVARAVVVAEEPGIKRGPGLLRISEDWMLELSDLCEERDEFIVAHMHSHGISAFHSDTDEHHIFHAPGCFSVVVPEFAQTTRARESSNWAVLIGAEGGSFESAKSTQVHVGEGSGDVISLSENGPRRA